MTALEEAAIGDVSADVCVCSSSSVCIDPLSSLLDDYFILVVTDTVMDCQGRLVVKLSMKGPRLPSRDSLAQGCPGTLSLYHVCYTWPNLCCKSQLGLLRSFSSVHSARWSSHVNLITAINPNAISSISSSTYPSGRFASALIVKPRLCNVARYMSAFM